MYRLVTLALAVALFFTGTAAASPIAAAPLATMTPTFTPTPPTPSPDPVILARSKSLFHGLQTGNVDRSQLASSTSAKLSDDTMKSVEKQIGPLGDPVTFEQQETGKQGGSMLYAYLVTFGNGTKYEFYVGFDANGKVDMIALKAL